MSARITSTLIEGVAEGAIKSAWLQWRSLGARVTASGRSRWIVDPEALVLVSLALRTHERRLWDVLSSWAMTDSGVLSVQRIKNLKAKYPNRINDRLGEFARVAFEEGGDFRWRNLAGPKPAPRARGKMLKGPSSKGWDPAALIVRLRLGLGVGLQADVLAFLISLRGAWASARYIADATDYNVYAIRRTADRMAEAQFIESTAGKPLEYRADSKAWKGFLRSGEDVPPWRFWHQAYAMVADLLDQVEHGGLEAPSSYLLSSRLRDLVEKHQDALRLNEIAYPEAQPATGEEYKDAFVGVVQNLTRWLAE